MLASQLKKKMKRRQQEGRGKGPSKGQIDSEGEDDAMDIRDPADGDVKVGAKKSSDLLPANSLPWSRIRAPGAGFISLEELDGVDVEVVKGSSGAKMIQFKRVDPNLKTVKIKKRKAATSEQGEDHSFNDASFDSFNIEDMGEFIHIDDFVEGELAGKPAKKQKKESKVDSEDVVAAGTNAKKSKNQTLSTESMHNQTVRGTLEEKSAVGACESPSNSVTADAPNGASKPPNKRERLALKRAAMKDALSQGAANGSTDEKESSTQKIVATDKSRSAEMREWDGFNLCPSILNALSLKGFKCPTEIQKRTLSAALNATLSPAISSKKDVIGAAPTGSGKTLAYGLPILQEIALRDIAEGWDKESKRVKVEKPCVALILTPTRELAMQVTTHLKEAGRFTSASVVSLVGGISLEKQRRLLSYYPDIIVATPGRLWELMSSEESLKQSLLCAKYFVLDEADRMLESGHFKDLDNILLAINVERDDNTPLPSNPMFHPAKSRQTFVFSATLTTETPALSKKLTSNTAGNNKTLEDLLSRITFSDRRPTRLNLSTQEMTSSTLTEARIDCVTSDDKDAAILYTLLRYPGRTIVFVNSIDSVRRLIGLFTVMGVVVYGLHSEMQQRQRIKNLERFKAAESALLVCSDVAARGLDIPEVNHVLNYHLPRSADTYVHRSGRTARASAVGLCLSLCGPQEVSTLKKICYALGKTDGLMEFPIDPRIISQIKVRLALAKKIENEEHKLSKKKHNEDWMRKAAEEAEMILDDDEGDSDNGSKNKSSAKIAQMRAELKNLLSVPLLSGVSGRFPAKGNGIADIMVNSSGLSMIPSEKPSSAVDDAASHRPKKRNKTAAK